jgi:hypothetical protein
MIPFIFIPSNLARVLSQIREPRVHVKAPVCFLVAECFSSWRRLVGQQSDFAAGDEGSDRLPASPAANIKIASSHQKQVLLIR